MVKRIVVRDHRRGPASENSFVWTPTRDEVDALWSHTESVLEADDAFYHRLAVYTMGVEAAEALAAELATDRDI